MPAGLRLMESALRCLPAEARLGSGERAAAMATFLWALQWGGLGIALVGLGRERWLTGRRASRHH